MLELLSNMLELLSAVIWLGVLALLACAVTICNDYLNRRVHMDLAQHAIKLALAAQSPGGYEVAMCIGRYHAHKAGFKNGFTQAEWDRTMKIARARESDQ